MSASAPEAPASAAAAPKPYTPPTTLSGLDLKSIAMDDNGAVAPIGGSGSGKIARLTLDPKIQIFVNKLLGKHKLPQAAVVMLEPSTGKVLAYASREEGAKGKDLNVDAFAPSASVFKVVTGAALVQIANVSPDLKMCYSGGENKVTAADLKDDPKRDTYCATVAQAMGRSINTVFARLASRKLSGPDLHAIAGQLGYGAAIPFDVPVTVSKIELPTDTLGFARTAAGFWNTTLSPLHAAMLAATVANGGSTMRPWIVSEVDEGPNAVWKAPAPSMWRKALEEKTASAVETMMIETVSQGTSYKAFHDAKGKAFLPGIQVAGKTGTLGGSDKEHPKLYTWFVGYAPVKNPKVAIAALVVNDPVWKIKANVLAREALQAYFAQQGAQGVQLPSLD
ncbi:MAG: penicillin-binding transpeptidase domain-containing protein [Polyangiales bacterium]